MQVPPLEGLDVSDIDSEHGLFQRGVCQLPLAEVWLLFQRAQHLEAHLFLDAGTAGVEAGEGDWGTRVGLACLMRQVSNEVTGW